MENQLALIKQLIGNMAQAQSKAGALQDTNMLLDTVKKNIELQSPERPEEESSRNPAQKPRKVKNG